MAIKPPLPTPGIKKPAGSGLMFAGGSASFDERTGTNRTPEATAKIVADTQRNALTQGRAAQSKQADFNKYAAGAKHYGAGRPMPNIGKTANKTGYAQRDAAAAARKDALLRRAQGGMK